MSKRAGRRLPPRVPHARPSPRSPQPGRAQSPRALPASGGALLAAGARGKGSVHGHRCRGWSPASPPSPRKEGCCTICPFCSQF